tara:strand:- start:2548 stop:2952 length:405 start_codon:yes stop_codon:yes gene_type:complete
MGDEFYAILKLVSGEEIFSLILVDNDQEDDTIIVLQNPVIMWTVATPNGTFIKVKPWMELPNEDIFMIRLDKVITMTESDDKKLIKLYNHYINGEESEYDINGLTKPDSEMGYISSVTEARKKLEMLFKLNKET